MFTRNNNYSGMGDLGFKFSDIFKPKEWSKGVKTVSKAVTTTAKTAAQVIAAGAQPTPTVIDQSAVPAESSKDISSYIPAIVAGGIILLGITVVVVKRRRR